MPRTLPASRPHAGPALLVAALFLAGCMGGDGAAPRAEAPPVSVETQRGHARVVLADGRRCRAAFPPSEMARGTGTLDGCGQPWAYSMELAPRTGSQTLADIVIAVSQAVGAPFGLPREPRRELILRIDAPDGAQHWRWRVWQGRDSRGEPGVPL